MYGLPQGLDCSQLVSRELAQVCVAEYLLSLHFGLRAAVHCRHALWATSPAGRRKRVLVKQHTVVPRELAACLGAKVASATARAGTLRIELSNSGVLQFPDQRGYEAYEIHLGERRIIV